MIDVAQAQAEARALRHGRRFGRRGRALTVGALAAVALILLLALGGYAWWRSYRRGPAYSLALLVDAARRDDLKAVEAMIDGDRIAQAFVPQVIEKLAGGAVPLPPQVQRGQLSAAIPLLIPRVRETMHEEIARNMKAIAEQAGKDVPTPLLALGISRAAEIKQDGDAATVSFKSGERAIELSMQRAGERWKVVAVRDDALAADIAARLAASLPAAPQRKK